MEVMVNRKLRCGMALMLSIAMATAAVQPVAPASRVEAATVMIKEEIKLDLTTETKEYQGENLVKAVVTLKTAESGIQAYGVALNYDTEKLEPVVILNEDEELDTNYYDYKVESGSIRDIPGPYNYDEDGKGSVNTQYMDTKMRPVTKEDIPLFIAYFRVRPEAYGTADISIDTNNTSLSGTGETDAEVKSAKLAEDSVLAVKHDTGIAAVTVTFDANTGSFADNTTKVSTEVAAGAKVDIPAAPSNGKATFLGWSTNKDAQEAEITSGTVDAKADVTYYAIWGKPALEGVTASISGTPVFEGELTVSAEGAPEDSGAAAYQWYRGTKADGSDKTAIAGATGVSYKASAEDVGNYLFASVSYAAYEGSALANTKEAVAKAAAAAKPKAEEISYESTDTQITVNQIPGAEYKLGDGTYQTGNVFTGLKAGTEYAISVRYAETATNLASEETVITAKTKNPVPVVDGSLTAETTYGTSLKDTEIQGSMAYGGNKVDGTFSWAEEAPENIYPDAGEASYKAVFTPSDEGAYSKAYGLDVTVKTAKKAITVTAASISAVYGQVPDQAAFDFEVNEAELKARDKKADLGLVLTANTTASSPAGTYDIVKKEAAGKNYEVTVAEGSKLTIVKADPVITLENLEETAGKATGAKAVLTPASDDANPVVEYQSGDAWTTEIPSKAGVYAIRAYLPEEKAGKNLNAVASRQAVTGKYTLKAAENSWDSGIYVPPVVVPGGDTGSSTGDSNSGKPEDTEQGTTKPSDQEEKPDTGKTEEPSTPTQPSKPEETTDKEDTKEENDKKNTSEKEVQLNKKKVKLKAGQKIKLKVKNTKKKITWISSKPKIAKVNKKGVVIARKAGTAVIKAKVKGGKTYKCKITVKKAVSSKKSGKKK